MKKKTYEKPTFTVIKIQQYQIICNSFPPGAALWGGEAGARRRGNDVWDDEDDWEDE